MNRKILWILIGLVFNVTFSQGKSEHAFLFGKVRSKMLEFQEEENFKKASEFFIKKEWDSTLLFSLKQLSLEAQSTEVKDYCNLYRGYSFFSKNVFSEAELELEKIAPTSELQGAAIYCLSLVSLEQNQFEKAIEYLKESEKLVNKANYLSEKKYEISQNLGIAYLFLKDYKLSERYLLKGVELIEGLSGEKKKLVRSYINLATLYYEQYLDDKAIIYFKKAYQLAQIIDDVELKQITALNMAVVEENRKSYVKSLIYRKEYEQWKDSVYNQTKVWQIAKLEKEFAVKQKQKEVSVLQAENKVKNVERNFFLYAALILLVVILLGAYYYKQKVKTNKIITSQKEDLKELNQSKDRLFSVVSHDLRSSVNALKISNNELIQMLAEKNWKELDVSLSKNSAIVNGAYNLLDNLLHWSMSEIKQSYFEMTELRLFILVEQMAYNYKHIFLDKNITFENNIPKTLKAYVDQESIKIVLRNLLDNAVKFSSRDGVIKINQRNVEGALLVIEIEDNGKGMSEQTRLNLLQEKTTITAGTGLGLQLCKTMIAKNKGLFDIESKLDVGTKIIISLKKKA